MNPTTATTATATATTHFAVRTGKSRRDPSEESAVIRPPIKKTKPSEHESGSSAPGRTELPAMHGTQQFGQQPAVDPKLMYVFKVYAETAVKSDLGKFPDYVKNCPDQAWPELAEKLTGALFAALAAEESSPLANCALVLERTTVAEAVGRIALALDNGLPVNEVVTCLAGATSRVCSVSALSLLLKDRAIVDVQAGKPVDLLSWTQCIGELPSAQDWMGGLGWSLALDSTSNGQLLRCWLSAMTSLADQVQSRYPTQADLVLALLNGFEGACSPDVDTGANLDDLREAHLTCERLRARLTREAERLVTDLDAAVRNRSDSRAHELCSEIVDKSASGVLTLAEVIDALEQFSSSSETVAVLMHVLVGHAKSGELYEFFCNVLTKAGRPEDLVPHMAHALLDGGDDIGLAVGLVGRLTDWAANAPEAAEAFIRLLLARGLTDALCLGFEDPPILLFSLNARLKEMVQGAAAQLVATAGRSVESATARLIEISGLDRTARLTAVQLELLGGRPVEGAINALAQSLRNPMACAYVVEALRLSFERPGFNYVVSLLMRSLLEHRNVDKFMGALVNADVPPAANTAHSMLARQVALGLGDWVSDVAELDACIEASIGAGRPAMGLKVLQGILDELALLEKWAGATRSRLVMRRREVEKLLMAAKARPVIDQYITPLFDLIASTRTQKSDTRQWSIVDDRDEILKNKLIEEGVKELVLAVRRFDIPMPQAIVGICFGEAAEFDRQLLLLQFINPLFQETAISSSYELNYFMSSLFDFDSPLDFFASVGLVFALRQERAPDRDRVINLIQTLFNQYKDAKEKLPRLQSFAVEYYEASNISDAISRQLSALLDAIENVLDDKDVPSGTLMIRSTSRLQAAAHSPVTQAALPSGQRVLERPSQQPGNPSYPPIAASPNPVKSVSIYTHFSESGSDSESAESEAEPAFDPRVPIARDSDGGLPLHYLDISLPPSTASSVAQSGVSVQDEIRLLASKMIGPLNNGYIETVEQVFKSSGLNVLNLALPSLPVLKTKGLETLGLLLSRPWVALEVLFLGNVERGITHVTDGVGKSTQLRVLNLCFFHGHDPASPYGYSISAVFSKLALHYPKSLSLQTLVVSRSMISVHKASPALNTLLQAAGDRLRLELKD